MSIGIALQRRPLGGKACRTTPGGWVCRPDTVDMTFSVTSLRTRRGAAVELHDSIAGSADPCQSLAIWCSEHALRSKGLFWIRGFPLVGHDARCSGGAARSRPFSPPTSSSLIFVLSVGVRAEAGMEITTSTPGTALAASVRVLSERRLGIEAYHRRPDRHDRRAGA